MIDCPIADLASALMWHPWRELRSRPEIKLEWRSDLPAELIAATNGQRIVMTTQLLQVERRWALAHELAHIDRGDTHRCDAADEAEIDQEVARKLIDLEDLLDAIRWAPNSRNEVADQLWVPREVLDTRLEHLHPAERAYLRRRINPEGEA